MQVAYLNRWMRFLILVLALAYACCTTSVQAQQVSVHDPVIAQEGDTYYLFSTGPGIPFYTSKNKVDWQLEGRIFAGEPAWAKAAAPGFNDHIWAPDIQFHNGRYYLYYSVSGFGKNASGIGVTVNKTLNPRSPDYQWQDQGMVLQSIPGRDDWNAIDPNIISDSQGQAWMAFGSFWNGIKLVKLHENWIALAQPQVWFTLAQRERPAFTPDASAGPAEIEAPFIFKKNDYYYLFVSWGLCCKGEGSTYHVVVGRAKQVTGPYLDKTGKDMAKGGGSLLLQGNAAWQGLGHNSVYHFGGKDYLVLHAYETADKYLQKLKILEMQWDAEGWPVVDSKALDSYQSKLLTTKK